ncbi:hypothetical protein L195_g002359 [Trifolium pratense]|uniref:Uncharacterized protein n=1 Tax=Trifolium pratense TaxID=57577 RepID=A0A2K3NS94_TRIPR|nr:hypothetical protein L195_g002359 [Trifolium pratense]
MEKMKPDRREERRLPEVDREYPAVNGGGGGGYRRRWQKIFEFVS